MSESTGHRRSSRDESPVDEDSDHTLSEVMPFILPDDVSILTTITHASASTMHPDIEDVPWLDAEDLDALPLGSVALCYRITPIQAVPVQKVKESGVIGWVPAGLWNDEILSSDFIAPAPVLVVGMGAGDDLPPNSCA